MPSDKQTAILKKNGFSADDILAMSPEQVSKAIEEIFARNKRPVQQSSQQTIGQLGSTQGISEVNHNFQSSYEFGPAGNRHTIKYFTVPELLAKKKELEDAGLLEVI